jgi:signal transduction histidine kinase
VKLANYLARQPRSLLMLLGLLMALVLGLIDHLTGPELSLSIFYLLPISFAAWLLGLGAGVATSLVCSVLWLLADLLSGYRWSLAAAPYWNAAVRLGLFLVVSAVLSALGEAQRRREELAQFVVHDLRAPLANVITGLETLLEIAGESLDAAQLKLVQSCLISGKRMVTLINSLLDLARLEAGKMPLEPRAAPVHELVESSLEQVAVWAERNRVQLTCELDPAASVVYADPAITTRVLVNLLSNAIKFSPPGSTASVAVSPRATGQVSFAVVDQGRGIPPEWASRVFERYAQVDARGTGRAGGSGLGLTFCRLAVEAQGGHIWVESVAGGGTSVTFTLPAGG